MEKGSIYNYYNENKKKYTALQLVDIIAHKNQYVFLALYYWNDNPLTAEMLDSIKPFWKDHHCWEGEYTFILCEGTMPNNYSFVGKKEIIALPAKEKETVENWDYDCLQISLQMAWDVLPEQFKQLYKKTKGKHDHLNLNNNTDKAPAELDRKPLTKLMIDGDALWLIDYLNKHHNITDLTWKNCSAKSIDLSQTRILDFKIETNGTQRIVLNDYLNTLSFFNTMPTDIEIEPAPKNRSFSLETRNTENLHVFKNLNIISLRVSGAKQIPIDIYSIALNLPNLSTLRMWGSPSNAINMDKIVLLKKLNWLTLLDIFGFTANDFPSAAELPSIKCIWMDSIPEDVAKKVKKEYKHISLRISKPRKPDWLEVNLNNPFRNWDGDGYVSPKHAKKAADLYIKLNKQIAALIKSKTPANKLMPELEEIIKVYTLEFNKMNKRTHWIDTLIREDIDAVLWKLFEPVKDIYKDKFDYNKLSDTFDQLRDF